MKKKLDKTSEINDKHFNHCNSGTPTWRFTRKPEWLKDFSPTAIVSQADARNGFLAVVKPIRAIPGPKKPIDCREDDLMLAIKL
jgi:hypothetical protein